MVDIIEDASSNSVLAEPSLDIPFTPWDRLQQEQNDREKILREVTQGKRIGGYRLKGNLGHGNFSVVKLGIHILTKERVAIKILDKGKLDHKTQRLLSREIEAMEQVHHPNILRLYEVIETLSAQYFILEYAPGGELYNKVSTKDDAKLSEDEARIYFAQIIDGIHHLHSRNISHRDIKAENIYFSSNGMAKVGDFGFSILSTEKLDTFCGSPPYAAPELFKDDPKIGYTGCFVDIWALGILLYFMLTGGMPFRAENVSKLKKCILEGTYAIPPFVSEHAANLIRAILIENPLKRMSIPEMKQHPWLVGASYCKTVPMSDLKPYLDDLPEDEDDKEAQILLIDQLGVPRDRLTEVLERGCKNGPRNHITGTYRIALHKVQNKKMVTLPVIAAPQSAVSKNNKKKKKKRKFPGRSRSKICVLM